MRRVCRTREIFRDQTFVIRPPVPVPGLVPSAVRRFVRPSH